MDFKQVCFFNASAIFNNPISVKAGCNGFASKPRLIAFNEVFLLRKLAKLEIPMSDMPILLFLYQIMIWSLFYRKRIAIFCKEESFFKPLHKLDRASSFALKQLEMNSYSEVYRNLMKWISRSWRNLSLCKPSPRSFTPLSSILWHLNDLEEKFELLRSKAEFKSG